MNLNDYQKQAYVTKSPNGHLTILRLIGQGANWNVLIKSLLEVFYAADFDKMKKDIFYADPGNVESLTPEEQAEIDLYHGNLGVLSEVTELEMLLADQDEIDKVHLTEELGDLMWYIALIASSQGITLDDVCQRNVEKLRARYPNKFTVYDAHNRDLENERQVLEGKKDLDIGPASIEGKHMAQ